jgi:hypothetical protein
VPYAGVVDGSSAKLKRRTSSTHAISAIDAAVEKDKIPAMTPAALDGGLRCVRETSAVPADGREG